MFLKRIQHLSKGLSRLLKVISIIVTILTFLMAAGAVNWQFVHTGTDYLLMGLFVIAWTLGAFVLFWLITGLVLWIVEGFKE